MRYIAFRIKFRIREFLRSLWSMRRLNVITAIHPIRRYTMLFGGTQLVYSGQGKTDALWEDNGEVRLAHTLTFDKVASGWTAEVTLFRPDDNGNPYVCRSCYGYLCQAKVVNPRVVLKDAAPLWARLWFRWWQYTGRVTA